MAAVVSGSSLGLSNASLHVLGQSVLGPAAQGRGGERIYLNAATGNLVIQGEDDVMVGPRPGRGGSANLQQPGVPR